MDYVARLVKTYPSMSREHVLWELPMMEGWCFFNWSIENDGWLQFAGVKRGSPGYVAQQAQELIEIAVEHYRTNGR